MQPEKALKTVLTMPRPKVSFDFLPEYTLFGVPHIVQTTSVRGAVKVETDIYPKLKRIVERYGWMFNRIETANQDGMPDILITRGKEYWQIEVKKLHKPKLIDPITDLTWQFGQLAYFKKMLARKSNYMLVVERQNILAHIKGAYNGATTYPDYIG